MIKLANYFDLRYKINVLYAHLVLICDQKHLNYNLNYALIIKLSFQTYFNIQICYGPVIDTIPLSKWDKHFLDYQIPVRKIYTIYNETHFTTCIKNKQHPKWEHFYNSANVWSLFWKVYLIIRFLPTLSLLISTNVVKLYTN